MVIIPTATLFVAIFALGVTPTPTIGLTERAFSFQIPSSRGTVVYKAPQVVKGVFDGGLKTYGRGVSCNGNKEGVDKDAVFLLEKGATLKNAIIGADQIEGVHCKGSCTIDNVWWTDVCEDALSLKGDGDVLVRGGGARNADDKVIQHNGFGTVTIDGFSVSDFGKLYRSCGNCEKNGGKRAVNIKNVKASGGKVLAGVNVNYGDVATITGTCATNVKDICVGYTGNNQGSEPGNGVSGPSKNCKFSPLPAC